MSTPVQIKSIDGNRIADVGLHGQLKVAPGIPDMLSPGILNYRRPLFSYLSLDGSISETPVNMNINAAAPNATSYYIKAQGNYDLYIRAISILIADDTIVHSNFGNRAPLVSGWELRLVDEGIEYDIIKLATTNAEVIAYAGGARPFDVGVDTWKITNYTAATSALLVYIPIDEQYVPGGFRMGMNSNSKIVSRLADDLTGLTEFYVRVFGYRHYLNLPI